MFSRRTGIPILSAMVLGSSVFALSQNIRVMTDEGPPPPESKLTVEEKKERDALQETLLNRAYGMTKEVSDSDKALLLSRLAEASAKNHAEKSKKWADEVFTVTANLSATTQRSQTEVATLMALAENDPEHALELLNNMEAPQPREGQPVMDPRSNAATMLFQRYWQKKGMESIDSISATARKLGENGAYPYMAMGMIVRQVKSKDAEKSQSLLNEALGFFSRRQTTRMGNDQFAMFLRANRSEISRPLMKDLLEKLVTQALAAKDDGTKVSAVIGNDKGQSARLERAASLLLFQLMPMIRDIDADWAKKLEADHQELRQAAEFARSGEQRVTMMAMAGPGPGGNSAQGGNVPRVMMEEVQSMEVDELSKQDPAAAVKRNTELKDPVIRAASGARLASTLAKSSPEQASELMKNAKEAIAETKEPQDKLRILVGLAQAQAAMNDKEAFAATLQTGYAMGEELFKKSIDKNPTMPINFLPGFDAMSRLTMSAVRVDYAATMAKLDTVRTPILQALLLVSAAEGLDPDTRPRQRGIRIAVTS